MADASPEDLSREIGRLWARVGVLSAATAEEIPATSVASGVAGAELAWETVAILKRQQRQREETWRGAMDARDEDLRVLRERLAAAEADLAERRGREAADEERLLVESLDARERIETAQKAYAEARARHDEERAILEAALQSLRERFAAEVERGRETERRWQAREQELLIQLQGLQSLAARGEKEAGLAQSEARGARASLAEAKDALERALAELIRERHERADADREREAALRRVGEFQEQINGLSKLWDEERAQWRALWERERAGWETRRAELARADDSLKEERASWRREREAGEKSSALLAEDLSRRARAAEEASARADERLRALGGEAAPPAAWKRWLRRFLPFAVF